MDTKKLRQKILDLAIHGKLVPQDPNDEPASVLLERISNEKKRLIKEGKIKRSKQTASLDLSSDDVPFELPEGWCWCLLPQISEHFLGKTLNKSTDVGENTQYLCSINIYWNDIALDNIKTAKFTKEERNKYLIQKGDILVCEGGDVGRSAIWNINTPMCFQNALHRIRLYDNIYSQYILFCIRYFKNIGLIDYRCKGVTIKHFTQSIIDSIPFPLPPLAEQQRIVSAVEQWMSVIDVLENNEEDLRQSIDKAKSKILDLAIRGKLVPQDSNDEPASELLKRLGISPDNCPCEDLPFELPNSWCWCRLGAIGKWQAGGTPSRMHKEYYGGNIPWLKTGDLNDDYITEIPEFITEDGVNNSSAKINPKGSVLIAMYGATIGKLGILTYPATTNQACCACVEYKGLLEKYLFYFLKYNKHNFIQQGGGGAQPNISKEIIVKTFIPLPPLAEQHRIVAKIEQLYSQLDEIESSLQS